MKTDTDITAAAIEIEVEGVRYRLTPLRDRDFGEFERWCQDTYLAVAKRNLSGLEREDRDALLQAAYTRASDMTISSPEALKLMSTIDGAAYLLYLSLRREQEMTYEKAKELATSPEILNALISRINELNGGDSTPNKKNKVKKKKTKK